jgi:DNA repair protein RecO (recombination protein O)
MKTKDTAICLRSVNYSETSQIVTLFTQHSGKLSAIAKGSKRPKSSFDGPIEVLSYGEVVFSSRDSAKLATLTQFAGDPLFSKIRNDLFSLNCGLFAAELLNEFTQEFDPHPELFDSAVRFLTDVQAGEEFERLGLLIIFQLTLLDEIGLKPILDGCANCKNPYSDKWPYLYFSSLANGFICNDCEQSFADKRRLSKSAGGALADMKLLPRASRKTLDEIEKTLIGHFTELMHKRPKMAKYVLNCHTP